MKTFFVQEGLTQLFFRLGGFVARHPLYFILLPVIFSTLLSTGFFYTKVDRDFDELFSASDGKAEGNRRLINRLFPINTTSHFEMTRATSPKQFIVVVIVAKDEGSLFRRNVFEEIIELDKMIRNHAVWLNGNFVNYTEICGRRHGKCVGNNFLELYPDLRSIVKGKRKIRYPLHMNNVTMHYEEYIQSIGGVKLDDNGNLRDVKAVRLIYPLDVSDRNKAKTIEDWQIEISRTLKRTGFNNIYVSFISQEAIKVEVKDYTNTLLKRAPIAVLTMLLFSFFTCMTNDWVKSKQWLGPSSCVSAGLAIATSFGLLFHIGVEYVDFCILLCYGVLATEIDDAFVLIASWRTTDPNDPVEVRMAHAYSESAVSITITSLTTVLSFSLGISSTIPGVRISCIYGACCCLFAYIYQLTFFGGCMALSGYREEKKLHPFTFRVMEGSTKSRLSRGELVSSQLRETLESLIMHNLFKSLITLVFFLLVSVGIYGITVMNYGNELADAFNSESPTRNTFKQMHSYFGRYSFPVHIIFNYHINYADPSSQLAVKNVIDEFKDYEHVAESELELSWLKYFKMFQEMPIGEISLRGFNMSDEKDFVYALRYVFFKLPLARQFVEDVKFDENTTKIIASRFVIPLKDVYSTETELETIRNLYEIADKASIPVDIFGLTFHLLEPSLIVPRKTIMLAVVSSCLICVIFLLFVPNIPCALCVSSVVLCSIVQTVGFVSLWGIRLDFISLIAFVYTIGLCINYPSHMSFAFLMGRNLSTKNRTKKALYALAYPISQGCSSTFLGMLVIGFHSHYVSQCGFKFISVIAFLTAFHALFTIPVFLNILGMYFKSLSVTDEQLCKQNKLEKEEKLQQPLTKECAITDK